MKKSLLYIALAVAAVFSVLAILVQRGKLPLDFWSLSLADKWTALKNLTGAASQPAGASQPAATQTVAGAAAQAAAQATSPTGQVTAEQAG